MTEYYILWSGTCSKPPHPLLPEFLEILKPILTDADAAFAAGIADKMYVTKTGVMIGLFLCTHPHIVVSRDAIAAICMGSTPTVVQRKLQTQERK